MAKQIGVTVTYTGGPARNTRVVDADGKLIEGVSQISIEWDATDTNPEIMLWVLPDNLHLVGLATVHGRCPRCGEDLPVKDT